jgi:hypothetical protein
MSDQLFSLGQINQLKNLFEANRQDIRQEMLDMFAHFEKRLENRIDQRIAYHINTLETRLGTMIFEIVNDGIAPRFDEHDRRLRAIERTLNLAT